MASSTISLQTIEPEQGVKLPVGLSACLAGFEVRFDGQHKRSSLCLGELSEHFHFETFCPEVAAGFGTPRPTMRLIGDPLQPTLAYTDPKKNTGVSLTDQLVDGFKDKLAAFESLDGYILMKNSPSCGMERVKVYQENGYPHMEGGAGLFAAALKKKFPLMPIEEEGRLHDAKLYENFVLRVYVHHNFRKEVLGEPSMHKLIAFHSAYKFVIMSHGLEGYKALGRIVANHDAKSLDEVMSTYQEKLFSALRKPATQKNHTNTLLHILGYLKTSTNGEARQNISATIHRYRDGDIPLVVPLTLLKHYIEQHGNTYIRTQRYLQPYPDKLGLQNKL
jgi:uncharacterized protein YbgA (DUF1722 family)/uncharacterized protein YbbK (DUF523 family)